MTSEYDVNLCKLDANVNNRTAIAGSVGFFKLEKKLFKGKKVLLYSKFYFENQMCKIKRYARKSIYHEYMVRIEKPSLGITVRHHSANLVKSISDPSDRFFYPHHTPMKDTYSLAHGLRQLLISYVTPLCTTTENTE